MFGTVRQVAFSMFGWMVMVGSRCTGKRRSGARNQARSRLNVTSSSLPCRPTRSRGLAFAAGGASSPPPADSCTTGASSTNGSGSEAAATR